MNLFNPLNSVWKNIQEFDLRALRDAAEYPLRLAIVATQQDDGHLLATQLQSSSPATGNHSNAEVIVASLESGVPVATADLLILLIGPGVQDLTRERDLFKTWRSANKPVIIWYHSPTVNNQESITQPDGAEWGDAPVLQGPIVDHDFLQSALAPVLTESLPEHCLALGRSFPVLRVPISQQIINETARSNATYALGTGLAEIVPVLNIPLNMTDMIVLTKSQALLAYKLGLTLGLPKEWQYYVTELGGVIGGGFLWRQLARSLVGLIPGLGIWPKVAVAYAGTYVVGQVVLHWYATGRHLTGKQMRALYKQALVQGRSVAAKWVRHARTARLPRLPRLLHRRPSGEPAAETLSCTECGTSNTLDALYCKHCGRPLAAGSA